MFHVDERLFTSFRTPKGAWLPQQIRDRHGEMNAARWHLCSTSLRSSRNRIHIASIALT